MAASGKHLADLEKDIPEFLESGGTTQTISRNVHMGDANHFCRTAEALRQAVALQEAKLSKTVLVGRASGCNASKAEVEKLIEVVTGSKAEGISFPFAGSPGVFQACLASPQLAAQLVDRTDLFIRQKLVFFQRWAPSMSELGVKLDFYFVWATFPRLPLQYLELLPSIGTIIGKFLSSKYTVKEMQAGALPTICLRMASNATLVSTIQLPWHAGEAVHWREQFVKFLDINLKCSFCNKDGHMHKQCPAELQETRRGIKRN